jgi:hypothetical protein
MNSQALNNLKDLLLRGRLWLLLLGLERLSLLQIGLFHATSAGSFQSLLLLRGLGQLCVGRGTDLEGSSLRRASFLPTGIT